PLEAEGPYRLHGSLRLPAVGLMSTIRIVKRVTNKNLIKKRRCHSIMAFEMIRLDHAAAEPLHQQLYRQIRDGLISATFNNSASRLPVSRELVADLGVSRCTVNFALSAKCAEVGEQTASRCDGPTFTRD